MTRWDEAWAVKTLVSFRFDPDLLDRLRRSAPSENRTLTNVLETVLKRSIDPAKRDEAGQNQPLGGDAQCLSER